MTDNSQQDDIKPLSGRGYTEKRNFIRMRVDANVSFTTAESQEKHNGRCRNLSGTGMLLETNKKLRVGNKINITLPSERSELPNLEATAEVIRVNPLAHTHTFEIGLAIRTMY